MTASKLNCVNGQEFSPEDITLFPLGSMGVSAYHPITLVKSQFQFWCLCTANFILGWCLDFKFFYRILPQDRYKTHKARSHFLPHKLNLSDRLHQTHRLSLTVRKPTVWFQHYSSRQKNWNRITCPYLLLALVNQRKGADCHSSCPFQWKVTLHLPLSITVIRSSKQRVHMGKGQGPYMSSILRCHWVSAVSYSWAR